MTSPVGLLLVAICVVDVVFGCTAGPGQELLTYDTEYNEPLKAPIQKVVRDAVTKRVDCLEAYITKADLTKGTSTNKKVRNWAQSMGIPGDEAGHLVGKILGGTGYRTYNIVPQSKKSNTSADWRTNVERMIRDKVRDNNTEAAFRVEPKYDNRKSKTRPYRLSFSYRFTDGSGDSGSVDN